MKILHVLSDQNIGGAGIYVEYLLRNAELADYVVALSSSSLLVKRYLNTKATICELPQMDNRLRTILQLYRLIKKNKIELVHTHSSFAARVAGKLAKIPVVTTKHCLETRKRSVLYRLLYSFFSDYFIAVSQAVKKDLQNLGVNANKIFTIYNGIERKEKLSLEQINKMKKENKLDGMHVIGIFARLSLEKDHLTLFGAMKKIRNQCPNTVLLVFGEGEEKTKLLQFIEKHDMKNYILMMGFTDTPSMWMNICDLCVLSSSSEAFALSLAEAMGLSICCVATDAGGVRELLGQGQYGVLVAPNDKKALANAIIELLKNNELRKKYALAGEKAIEEKFNATRFVTQTENVYDQVLGGKKNETSPIKYH